MVKVRDMAERRILQIADPTDQRTLKLRSQPVRQITPAIRQLAADMAETMHTAGGVGIAAPQVGVNQRLTVIYIPPEMEKLKDGTEREVEPEQQYVLLNPQIVKVGEREVIGLEGCLSMPGWYGEVPRANWVTVEYTGLDGKVRRIRRATGLLGRALQHEIDHLDGILFTERIRDLTTLKDYSEEQEQPAEA